MRRSHTVESMRTDSLTPVSALSANPSTPWRAPPNLFIPQTSPAIAFTPDTYDNTAATTPDPLRSKSPIALPTSYSRPDGRGGGDGSGRDSLAPSVDPTPTADDNGSGLGFGTTPGSTDPFTRTYLHAEYGRSSLAKPARQATQHHHHSHHHHHHSNRPIGRLQPVYLAHVTAVQSFGGGGDVGGGGMSTIGADSSKATSVYELNLNPRSAGGGGQRISFAIGEGAGKSSPGGVDSKSDSTKSSTPQQPIALQLLQQHQLPAKALEMEESHRVVLRPRSWSIAGKPQPLPTPEALVQQATCPDPNARQYGYVPPAERRALSLALVPGATALSAQATLAPTDAGGAMHFKAIRQRMKAVEEEANRASQAVISDSRRKLQAVEDALKRRVVHEANHSVPVERPRPSLALIAELQRRGTLSHMGSSPTGIRRGTLAPQESIDVARDAGLLALITSTAGDYDTGSAGEVGGGSRRSTTVRSTNEGPSTSTHYGASATNAALSQPSMTPASLLAAMNTSTGSPNRRSIGQAGVMAPMTAASALETLAQVKAAADASNRREAAARRSLEDHPGAAVTVRLFRARQAELMELEEERARQVIWREEGAIFRSLVQTPFDEYHSECIKLVDAILEHQQMYGTLYLPWETSLAPGQSAAQAMQTSAMSSTVSTTVLTTSQRSHPSNFSPSSPSLMSSTLHTFGLRGRSDSRITALREAVEKLQDGTAADISGGGGFGDFGNFGAFANPPTKQARTRIANVVSPKSMLQHPGGRTGALEQWKDDAARFEQQSQAHVASAMRSPITQGFTAFAEAHPPMAIAPTSAAATAAAVARARGQRQASEGPRSRSPIENTDTETNDDAVSMRSDDSLNMGPGDFGDNSGTATPNSVQLRSDEEPVDYRSLLTKSLSSFTAFGDAAPSPVMSVKKRSSRKSFAAIDRERKRFLREVEELRSLGRLESLLVVVFKKITQQRERIPALA